MSWKFYASFVMVLLIVSLRLELLIIKKKKKNAISPILLSYLYIKKKKKKKKYNEKLGPRSHDWEREPAVAYAAPFLAYPDIFLFFYFFMERRKNCNIENSGCERSTYTR